MLVAKQATEEQHHDLMRFRPISEKGLEQYIQKKYLRIASANPPVRQKQLCTFSAPQNQKRRKQQIVLYCPLLLDFYIIFLVDENWMC